MNFEIEGRPEIEYPCVWEFRTIGPDNMLMRAAIFQVLGDRPCTLQDSHVSRHGRYVSVIVSVEVQTEEQRNAIFASLTGHPDIKFVL